MDTMLFLCAQRDDERVGGWGHKQWHLMRRHIDSRARCFVWSESCKPWRQWVCEVPSLSLIHQVIMKPQPQKPKPELPSWQIRNEGQKSWKWGTMRDKKIWMRDKMRDIMEHVLKLYSYLYGTCNRHSRLTEGRRRLSSYSFDDQNEFQSSRYPNSLWLKSWGVLVWLFCML